MLEMWFVLFNQLAWLGFVVPWLSLLYLCFGRLNGYRPGQLAQKYGSDLVLRYIGPYLVTVRDALTLLSPDEVDESLVQLVLNPGWLSSQVMDAFLWTLQQKHDGLVAIPTSLRFPDYEKITRRTRAVLIPILVNQHWTLLVFDSSLRRIIFFDSERSVSRQTCSELNEYINSLMWRLGVKTGWECGSWEYEEPLGFPTQQDGYNCGTFVCLVAMGIAEERTVDEMNRISPSLMRKLICLALGIADILF